MGVLLQRDDTPLPAVSVKDLMGKAKISVHNEQKICYNVNMKLVQKITLVTTIVFAANLANLAFPFFAVAQTGGGPNDKVEVHLMDINIQSDTYAASTGIADDMSPRRTLGHFINSFGTPYGMLGLNNFNGAESYSFALDGTVTAMEIAVSPDTFDAGATVISDAAGVALADEEVTAPIVLPFNVSIFGQASNQIAISSNGFIYVESNTTPGLPSNPGCCSGYRMDTENFNGDDYLIAGSWANLDPSLLYVGGPSTIKTEVFGTAPNRRFVIQYENMVATNGAAPQTFQIKLFEVGGGPTFATGTGTGEETIDPGILQLTNVPANFNFPGVNIVNFETYSTTYTNLQTNPERLTAEDRRFSGGFEVQMTATEYIGQTNPANRIPVGSLGVLTQVPDGTTNYVQTTQLQNGYSAVEGTLMTGSQQYGTVLTQTVPFGFAMFGRESNQIYICTSGIIIQAGALAGMAAADFNDLCQGLAGPPAGNYSYLLPYLVGGSDVLTTQTTGGLGIWNPDNGVYYNQVSDNEVHIRYKANIRNADGNPSGSVEFTVFIFRDGRIEYHEGPNTDTFTTPTIAIGDNGNAIFIQASEAPFGVGARGSDVANSQIRFTPTTTVFNDVRKAATPPVYAATYANSTTDPANFTMFTEDPGNPGFSVPVSTLEGGACINQGRLGNYTVYPSFILQIPPTTPADTYQNTITFTIIDKTYPLGSGFCPVM